MVIGDTDEFIEWTQSRLRSAETALHNGDPEPRLTLWSSREPVSVLGAMLSEDGEWKIAHRHADTAESAAA